MIGQIPQEIPGFAPSYAYLLLVVASLLFGGHGIVSLWIRSRKDVIISLQKIVTDQAKTLGELQGKVSALERLTSEQREEKRYYRNKAHKYRLLWITSRAKVQELRGRLKAAGVEVEDEETPQS